MFELLHLLSITTNSKKCVMHLIAFSTGRPRMVPRNLFLKIHHDYSVSITIKTD